MHRKRGNRIRAFAPLALLSVLLLMGAAGAAPPQSPPAHPEYVCPMPEHAEVFDHPGTCPICGMQLVPRTKRVEVAIMVFDGVEIIDYTGPYEVFGQAGFRVFTVGPTKEPITTVMGMKVIPAYDFATAPPADVVVLPGGGVDVGKARIVEWVKQRGAQSAVVLSVCNGAFWLAKAGLLDGLTATTTHGRIEELQTAFPKVRVVRDQRWVDNGRIITAAGLSSGLEGALHVVEKLRGHGKARAVALGLEYDWRPDSGWSRANLADRYVGNLNVPGDDLSYEEVSADGDLDHWRMEGLVTTSAAPDVLIQRLGEQLERQKHWIARGPTLSTGAVITRAWSFKDEQGRPWSATLRLAPGPAAGQLASTFAWSRDGAPAAP